MGRGPSRRVRQPGQLYAAALRGGEAASTSAESERFKRGKRTTNGSPLEPVHDLLSSNARKAKWMNCKLVLS
jgi:hypothetical protein